MNIRWLFVVLAALLATGCAKKEEAEAEAPAPAGQASWQPEPAIMVPFDPCPTVPAGHGIHGAWLPDGEELEPVIFARAATLRAVSMDMTGGYAKSVRLHAPQATICIDPYHVYLQ